jgi:hypothetical protein
LQRHLHLARHQHKEFGKIDCAIAIGVHLVDHILQLSFCGVLPQRAHDSAQLCTEAKAHSVQENNQQMK